jgi:hypothetical protein
VLSPFLIGIATYCLGYKTALRSYEMGPSFTASELKVDCGKNTNWLLFGSDQLRRFRQLEHALTINIKEEAI